MFKKIHLENIVQFINISFFFYFIEISVSFLNDEPLYFNVQDNSFQIEYLKLYFPFAIGLYYVNNTHNVVVDIVNKRLQIPSHISNFKLLYRLEGMYID